MKNFSPECNLWQDKQKKKTKAQFWSSENPWESLYVQLSKHYLSGKKKCNYQNITNLISPTARLLPHKFSQVQNSARVKVHTQKNEKKENSMHLVLDGRCRLPRGHLYLEKQETYSSPFPFVHIMTFKSVLWPKHKKTRMGLFMLLHVQSSRKKAWIRYSLKSTQLKATISKEK